MDKPIDKLMEFAIANPLQTVGMLIGGFFAIVITWKLLRFALKVINVVDDVGTRRLRRWQERKAERITAKQMALKQELKANRIAKEQRPKEKPMPIPDSKPEQKEELKTSPSDQSESCEDWDKLASRQAKIKSIAEDILKRLKRKGFDLQKNGVTVVGMEMMVEQGRINNEMLTHILDGKADFIGNNTVYRKEWESLDPRKSEYWNGFCFEAPEGGYPPW